MGREKEIEEMAEAIFHNCNCGLFFSEAEKIARFVIEEQGYEKQSRWGSVNSKMKINDKVTILAYNNIMNLSDFLERTRSIIDELDK